MMEAPLPQGLADSPEPSNSQTEVGPDRPDAGKTQRRPSGRSG